MRCPPASISNHLLYKSPPFATVQQGLSSHDRCIVRTVRTISSKYRHLKDRNSMSVQANTASGWMGEKSTCSWRTIERWRRTGLGPESYAIIEQGRICRSTLDDLPQMWRPLRSGIGARNGASRLPSLSRMVASEREPHTTECCCARRRRPDPF